ncbi:MAG: efflux RND transporter periplasmic adaptor subunit, partial [Tepidisphaeraceae bacterium]
KTGDDTEQEKEMQQQAGPTVRIDPAVVQNMGVQTAEATRGPITKSVQTVGLLEAPETGLHDISPKVGGWIEKLFANQEGMHVHKGEPLFEIYSPDLIVAEQELVGAVRAMRALGSAADPSVKKSSDALVESAKTKLRLLDVAEADIDAVAQTLAVPKTVTFRSPASGAVIDKAIVEGSATQPGQKLMRIEDHSILWLDLQVYEDQMAMVAIGQNVRATVEAFPGKTFTGRITFIHPHVDHMSRTVVARAVLDNPELALRPGMYASATIVTQPVADAVQVPKDAVIDTGTRQIVFVAHPGGRFTPRTVHVGVRGDNDRVQLIDGLAPGETVVTSGQFLLDVESRTTEAIQKLRSPASLTANSTTATAPAPPEMPTPSMAAAPPASALKVAWCPMKKAHWLQQGDAIANPYYGTQMPDCGELQRTVAMPVASSPLTEVTMAYLNTTAGLTSNRLDTSAIDALRTAAEKLNEPQLAEVKSAALAVASAGDVAKTRVALIPLSEALLRALDSGPATDSAPSSMPSMPGMEGMQP